MLVPPPKITKIKYNLIEQSKIKFEMKILR